MVTGAGPEPGTGGGVEKPAMAIGRQGPAERGRRSQVLGSGINEFISSVCSQ